MKHSFKLLLDIRIDKCANRKEKLTFGRRRRACDKGKINGKKDNQINKNNKRESLYLVIHV